MHVEPKTKWQEKLFDDDTFVEIILVYMFDFLIGKVFF